MRAAILKAFWISCCLFAAKELQAATYILPEQGNTIGEIQYSYPEPGETLSDVGIRFNIGFEEMRKANPRVNVHEPLASQLRLRIPSQFHLPQVARQGVVINLAEYRLYYYPPNDNVVITMPVGIGKDGWNTPLGLTKIISKERDPVWRPSAKLREDAEKKGVSIPAQFPPGRANPLGRHILRLGWPTYLIHGSNNRNLIGTKISAGCIRMLPEDIEYLFEQVKTGTVVRVINQSNE